MTYPHEQWQSMPDYASQPQPSNPPNYPPGPVPGYPSQGWPTQYPAYPPASPKKSSKGLIIGLVVAAVVIVLAVFVAPVVFFAKMTGDINDTISQGTGGQTEQILEDELEVTFGKFVRTDTEYRKDGKLPVTFRNKGSERTSFYVQIEAIDSDGDRIAEDTASVTSLAGGQSTTEELFTFSENVEDIQGAEFRVASVSKH